MHLFFVFARNYPISSALMVLGLIFAALAEGVGIGAMLPLFALVLRQQSGTDAAELGGETDIERRVADLFTSMGIEVTLTNLAIVLLSTLIVKAGLVIAAKRQVGYTVAQSA
ncbi:MAG: hypothetical protein ABGW98_18760, partial [Myxococcales bacterium]